jgi:hypothetical protein
MATPEVSREGLSGELSRKMLSLFLPPMPCPRKQPGFGVPPAIFTFNIRTGGCILAQHYIAYEQVATFGFGQKTGFNERMGRCIIKVRSQRHDLRLLHC